MNEKILVRGIKLPGEPAHSSMPHGPLVPVPGTVAPLSAGGDGGAFAGMSQSYIGWRREACEPDPMRMVTDYVRDAGRVSLERVPVRFRWVYDPTPVLVELTIEIRRALAKGDIEAAVAEAKPQARRGGGEA